MLDTGHLFILTESHVGQIPFAIVSASSAVIAGMLEIEHANALANFPVIAGFAAERDDCTNGLMGWCQRQLRAVDTFVDLVVGVAETGCADLQEKVILAILRNRYFLDLVRLLKLPRISILRCSCCLLALWSPAITYFG